MTQQAFWPRWACGGWLGRHAWGSIVPHKTCEFNIASASIQDTLDIRDLAVIILKVLVSSKRVYFQTQESVVLRTEGYLLER